MKLHFAKFKFDHYRDEIELAECLYEKFEIREICTISHVGDTGNCTSLPYLNYLIYKYV